MAEAIANIDHAGGRQDKRAHENRYARGCASTGARQARACDNTRTTDSDLNDANAEFGGMFRNSSDTRAFGQPMDFAGKIDRYRASGNDCFAYPTGDPSNLLALARIINELPRHASRPRRLGFGNPFQAQKFDNATFIIGTAPTKNNGLSFPKLLTNVTAIRAFLRRCFARLLDNGTQFAMRFRRNADHRLNARFTLFDVLRCAQNIECFRARKM